MPIFEDDEPIVMDEKAKKEFLAKKLRLKTIKENEVKELLEAYEDNNGSNEYR